MKMIRGFARFELLWPRFRSSNGSHYFGNLGLENFLLNLGYINEITNWKADVLRIYA